MFGANGCMDMGSLVTANGMSNERKWSFCDLNGKRGTKHGFELKNDRKRNLQVITEVNEILREKKEVLVGSIDPLHFPSNTFMYVYI